MSWTGLTFTSLYFISLAALLCLPLFRLVGLCLSHFTFKSERHFSIVTMAIAVPIALLLSAFYTFTLPPLDGMDNESPCHDTRADYEC